MCEWSHLACCVVLLQSEEESKLFLVFCLHQNWINKIETKKSPGFHLPDSPMTFPMVLSLRTQGSQLDHEGSWVPGSRVPTVGTLDRGQICLLEKQPWLLFVWDLIWAEKLKGSCKGEGLGRRGRPMEGLPTCPCAHWGIQDKTEWDRTQKLLNSSIKSSWLNKERGQQKVACLLWVSWVWNQVRTASCSGITKAKTRRTPVPPSHPALPHSRVSPGVPHQPSQVCLCLELPPWSEPSRKQTPSRQPVLFIVSRLKRRLLFHSRDKS